MTVIAVIAGTASPAFAAPDPSKVGDLTGNFDPITYVLIPVALLLALLTALVLGSRGDPARSARRTGGVSRALSRAESSAHRLPT